MVEVPDLTPYVRTWDSNVAAWTKRGDAVDFATFLAAELKLNPKAIITDKDGKVHRVYIPLINTYWDPTIYQPCTTRDDAWKREYVRVYHEVKKWATE